MVNSDIYQGIFSGFMASLKAMQLYPEKHPQVQAAIDRCFAAMEDVLREELEIVMLVMDDTVFCNGKSLPAGPAFDALFHLMRQKGVDQVAFRKGLTKALLVTFLKNLTSKETAVVFSQSHIQLGTIVLGAEPRTPSAVTTGSVAELPHPLQAAKELRSLYEVARREPTLSTADINSFVADFVTTFNVAAKPLGYLADIKSEDEYTFIHTVNVALLAVSFASSLGLSGGVIPDIACAALMHDIGKMFVPDEILNKPGALTPEERAIMELHPINGALHLGRVGGLPRLAMVVALEHHIKHDGTGYPHLGLGWKPHWVSQLVSIADIYDALRSRRPYRESLPQQQVFDILIKDSGTVLNPEFVTRFIDMVQK